MKNFTHPEGIFEINIPLEWNYMNDYFGYEHKNPFSFERYDNSCGCFQISCYHKSQKEINEKLPIYRYFQKNITFSKVSYNDDDGFRFYLWTAKIEDYVFMAKYVCQPNSNNICDINSDLIKVERSLESLLFIDEDNRLQAICFDRFEKFCSSLAASFDLKNLAIENKNYIQHIIMSANQIDAYLRLCIVLKIQISEKTDLFKLEYLFQSETDKPIAEKTIFKTAKDMSVISQNVFNDLWNLYNARNKIVHRYIISDIKTHELVSISYKYELLAEEIRLILEAIEEEQYSKKIGYYSTKHPHREKGINHISELYSMVNNKHLYNDFMREL